MLVRPAVRFVRGVQSVFPACGRSSRFLVRQGHALHRPGTPRSDPARACGALRPLRIAQAVADQTASDLGTLDLGDGQEASVLHDRTRLSRRVARCVMDEASAQGILDLRHPRQFPPGSPKPSEFTATRRLTPMSVNSACRAQDQSSKLTAKCLWVKPFWHELGTHKAQNKTRKMN